MSATEEVSRQVIGWELTGKARSKSGNFGGDGSRVLGVDRRQRVRRRDPPLSSRRAGTADLSPSGEVGKMQGSGLPASSITIFTRSFLSFRRVGLLEGRALAVDLHWARTADRDREGPGTGLGFVRGAAGGLTLGRLK